MADDGSFILKKRDLADIIRNPDKTAIEELLDDPGSVLAAALTDLFTSGPIAFIRPGVRIAQEAFKGDAFRQLGREVRALREKGKLPEDFSKSKYGYQSWVGLLGIIDGDVPDADRLEALKAMFYGCNKINAIDGERILSYQLFQIAKKLNSNELLVLKNVYAAQRKESNSRNNDFRGWTTAIASNIGHSLTAMVDLADKALVENQLLSARSGGDGSGINPTNWRLTDLGLKFCENVERYQIEMQAAKKSSEKSSG